MSTTLTPPTAQSKDINPPAQTTPELPNSSGYNSRLAVNIQGKKLFQFFFKKGHTIRSIVLESDSFDSARADCDRLALHFGMRYVSVRPFVFSVDELLKLDDLPNYV